jgi:hypothetical protein
MVIPDEIRDLLWEYDLEGLDSDANLEDAVIERVMQRGRWNQMRWLLRHMGRQRLRLFLEDRGHRRLPPRELRFWALLSGVPEETRNDWVHLARTREREWRG